MKTYKFLPEIAILIFALAIRLFFVSQVEWQALSDSRDYQTLAKNLIDGEGYIQIYQGESPEYQGMTFRAYRMPGYALVLAGFFKVLGYQPKLGLYLNLIFDLLTLTTIFCLAPLMGRLRANLSALIFALHILWLPLLMSESLVTFCLTGLTAILALKIWARSLPLAFISATLLATAIMTKPVAVVFAAFFVWQYLFSAGRHRHNKIFLVLILPLLALSLWGIRNYKIFHAPILFSTNFGPHNAPDFGINKPDLVSDLRAQKQDEFAINRNITEKIIAQVRSDPAAALKIYLARIRNIFSTDPVSEITNIILPKLYAKAPWAAALYRRALSQYAIVYILGGLGLVCMLIMGGQTRIFPVLFLSFILLHCLVSNGNIRFMAPVYPILCISCAWLLCNAYAAVAKFQTGTKS